MLGNAGNGASDSANAWIPLRKPGRVTRNVIDAGSWQSTQLTGWAWPESYSFLFSS